jgi:hypothetical protein
MEVLPLTCSQSHLMRTGLQLALNCNSWSPSYRWFNFLDGKNINPSNLFHCCTRISYHICTFIELLPRNGCLPLPPCNIIENYFYCYSCVHCHRCMYTEQLLSSNGCFHRHHATLLWIISTDLTNTNKRDVKVSGSRPWFLVQQIQILHLQFTCLSSITLRITIYLYSNK